MTSGASVTLRRAAKPTNRRAVVSERNGNEGNELREPVSPEDLRKERPIPAGWDRRAFLMRSALATAIAALTGNPIPASATTTPRRLRRAQWHETVAEPGAQQDIEGARDDPGRRVLQGGARALLVAHHRADADHLRFLPALHQAAAGAARSGDGAEGPSVRQPVARPARAMAPSAPRSPGSSARSRRRSTRPSSTRWRQSRTRSSRSSSARASTCR